MSESEDGPRFHCPSCKKSYRWKPELAGKKAKCKCGAVMAIPASPPAAARAPATRAAGVKSVAPARAAPPKPKAVREEDPFADPFGNLESAAQAEAAAPPAAPRGAAATATECPSCGADLPRGARLCVECGYNLETGEQLGMAATGATAAPAKASTKAAADDDPEMKAFRWKGLLWIGAGILIIAYGAWQYFDLAHMERTGGDLSFLARKTRRIYEMFGKLGVLGSAVFTGLISIGIGVLQYMGKFTPSNDD